MFLKNRRFLKLVSATGIIAISGSVAVGAHTDKCPSAERMIELIGPIVGKDNIKGIAKINEVGGLCEVVVESNFPQPANKYALFYTDQAGKYVIIGQMFEGGTNRNLSRETLREFTKWPKELIDEAKSLAFTVIGEGDEEVIFITDPLCPYCRNTLPAIEQLSKMGVKVYVVAVPLHGERSVKIVKGVICEGKSVQDLHTYTPPEDFASCEKADKIVEDSLKFFAKAGVGGTPAIVSARSGAVQLGMVRSAEDIIQILNLQSSAADNKGKESKESKSKEDEKDKTSEKIESLLKKHD